MLDRAENARRNFSLGQMEQASVTAAECSAMRLLHLDGYSQARLGRMFEIGKTTAHRHASGKCTWHAPSNGDGRADS